MATIFDPNAFDDVTHDESAGLQTSGVPNTDTGEDNDDDDILLSSIGSLLTTLTGLGAPATAIGAARNQVLTFVGDADPELSFRLAGDVTTLASGLMTNADSTLDSDNLRDPITLVVINDTTIFGYANYGLTGQRVAFALVLSETSTGAEITIVQYEALFNTNPSSPDDFLNLAGLVYVDASESFDFDDFSAAPAGQNLWTSVSDSSGTVEILVTGLSLGTDTVNTRATSLGSNNQSIEPGEGLRFDFVDGQALPTSTTAKDLTNIGYTSRIEGDTGGFTMAQVGGSPNNRVSAQVTAYDSSDTASDFSDGGGLSGTVQTIVKVEVYLGNTLISSWQRTSATTGTETTPTGGDAVLEYRVTDFDSVTIDGLKTNYRVSFTVADVDGIGGDDTGAMDRFVVQNVSTGSGNKSFDLGNIRLSSSEADSAEVGTFIRFEDDGPTATIALGTGSVTHDETAGVQNAAMTLPADAGDLDDNDQSGALPAAFNGIAGTLIGWARSAAAVVTTTGSAYGADSVGGTTALSLKVTGFTAGTGVDSGIDTTNGTNIFLYEETGRVVGKVGATEAEAKTGAVAFAIAIGNDGFLSTAQYLSLKHLDPATLIAGDVSSYDEAVSLAENLLKAVVTVTDGDLDVRTAEVGVGDRVRFEDDGPLPIDPEHATLTNAAGLPATFLLDEDLVPTSFADNYGQDGPETTYRGVVFAGSAADDGAALYAADTTSPQLTSDGLPIYLEGFGTATLTAYTGSGLTKQTIFTVSLDGSSGEYSVDMEAKIDNGSISFDNFGSGGAGLRYWLGVAGTEDASKDLLVTGATPNTNTINNDSDDIATGNQWIDPSEMVRLDFVSGIGTTTGTSDVNNIPPASHYLVNDVGFTVMQTKANSQVDVRIAAIDAARDIDGTDGTSVTADLLAGTLDTITSVSVIDGTTGIETVYERSAAVQVGTVWRSSDGKVLWDDNTDGNGLNDNRDVIVFNIDAPTTTTRDQVFVSTANGFTRLEITNVDPSNQHALAIGGFDVGGDAGEPVELEFDVNVVDGDGDAAVGLIGITLNPETVV